MVDNPRPIAEKNPDLEKNVVVRRRVTEKLPALLNTDLIKKFFAGSGDHLYQPEVSEKLAGFIGRIPAHFKKGQDFYIAEQTNKRRDYQLEPTTISTDPDTGALTNIMFYEDILNLLRFQGGLVNNQDRLFDTEFYSWSPCIDLDKIMNFTNYFWFPAGPDVVRISVPTNIGGELGTSDPVIIDGIEFFDGMRVVFENDVDFSFNDRVFIVDGIGVSFTLLLETELFQHLWDDPIIAWDEGPWDGPDPELAISFNTPDYIVVQRGSTDGSAWSVGNRWYHRDELNDTQFSIALERQALRPIIEFCRNLELFNHGTFGRAPVTVRDDVTTDPDLQLLGLVVAPVIDGITISNGDIILFTNSPSLQGTWDIGPWDNEDNPDGEWDEFINVIYSAPAFDIVLGLNTITTVGANFLTLGFDPGMKIVLSGTPAQDGEYTIDTVSSSTITLTESFVNTTGIGIPIPNNITIIEQRTLYQNRVFKVDGIGTVGGLTLTLVTDGQNEDGSPSDGDQIKVLLGLIHQGNSYYWSDAESEWLLAQQKDVINQAPLFQLYDTEATKLQDPGKYPSSDFAGSKLFSYQVNNDPRQPVDSELGIPLVFNEFGEIVFQNFLVTDRFNFGTPAQEIIGFYFHKTIGETTAEDAFNNDWYLSKIDSRQFLIDTFITDDDTRNFDLTLTPDNDDEVTVFVNGDEKTDQRWDIVGNQIQFFDFFENDDILQVRYFSSGIPLSEDTTYEIPINLEGNPDNEEVEFIANSDYFAHFTSIIKNQEGLTGNPNGTNNWRDTIQDRSIGTEILQHQAPMLKLMAIGSNRNIDFMFSVRYAEREFSRFRNKFIRKITEFNNDGIHDDTIDLPSLWVEDALSSINLGKTTDFPFAFSGMGTRTNNEPTFIPPSPSRLGVFPVFKPEIFLDTTFQTPQNVIQMHDGSIIIAFNDFRDDVILELENNIFDSIPEEYKTEELPDFNFIDFVDAEFREGDYSVEEFNQLLTPIIQRWATSHNLDLTTNDVFDQNDPFTFNYGTQGLPGYWRGIFELFYDTDKPNTHPWEMFGFSQKPDYWDARYGLPPYTSTNTLLWDDMRIGTIAGGTRQGVDERFARPTAPIPVDAVGNILDPIAVGIATQPGILDAKADWKIGDRAPVETVFRRSEFWSFAISQISYLMKPARFIEIGWDSKLQLFRYEDDPAGNPQWISTDKEDRKRHSEITVHGEELDDETIFTSDGIQQWITDFVVSNGQSITVIFGDVIRGLQPRLGHKMAGFINTNATRVLADNFGLVPQEDIGVNLYRNRSIREEIYSGVIIERVAKGWAVFGYDVLDKSFTIFPPVKTSRQIAIDIGAIRVSESTVFKEDRPQEIPYGTVFETQQEVYDFLISYGKFLESRGWIFDEIDTESREVNNWRLSGKQYLFWSLGRWAVGSLISLSPSSTKIRFGTERGAVQSIEQIINGVYSLLDRDGRVIQPEQTFVTRFNDELTVIPEEEQSIYSARLFIAEFEHVLTFNNRTIFNDLIYNPLLKLRQSRFKVFTTRAGGWVGRFDAPGFIITENNLLPNYEKVVNDFRRYFEIEDVVERPAIQDTARRLFGFQTRDYLTNLLLSNDTQFQFMQGFIRKKGTPQVLDRLLRSDTTSDAEELQFFEEWALRLGEYGAIQDSITVELLARAEEVKASPQLIEFKGSILRNDINETDVSLVINDASNFPDSAVIKIDDEILFYTSKVGNTLGSILQPLLRGQKNTEAAEHLSGAIVSIEDNLFDDVILIAPNDERWIRRAPNDENVTFPFRDLTNTEVKRINGSYLLRTDVRIAGYPLDSEVTHRVQTIAERNDLFDDLRVLTTDENLAFGDTVWVDRIGDFYTINDPDNLTDDDPRAVFNFEFMVFRYTSLFGNTVIPLVVEWEIAEVAVEEGDPIDISTFVDPDGGPHGLNNGDLVMIDNVFGVTPSLIGSFLVNDIGFSFDGDGTTDTFSTSGATIHPDSTDIEINGISQIFLTDYEIGGGEITEVIGATPDALTILDEFTINGSSVVLLASVPATAIGTPGITYTNGESIIINGTTVTLSTGITINDAITDIVAAGPFVPAVTAETANGALKLSSVAGDMILAEGTTITRGDSGATYASDDTIIVNGTIVTLSSGNAIVTGSIGATYTAGEDIIINGNNVFLSASATGTIGATYVNGEDIVINGNVVVLSTGTTVADAVTDITAAAIFGITAIDVGGALKITSTVPLTLAEGVGTALASLGLPATVIFGDIDDAVADITAAAIPGITATNVSGALEINSSIIALTLAEGSGTALANLGFIPGTTARIGTVADAVTDITTAAIPDITAISDAGGLKISSSNTFTLAEGSGTALDDLGLISGTHKNALLDLGFMPGTIIAQLPTVDSVVENINNAGIANIESENVDGVVVIRNTSGESLTLVDTLGTPLLDLGLTPGIFTSPGTDVRFFTPPPVGTNNVTFRRENHFRVNVPITNIDEIDLSEATIGIFTEARFLTEAITTGRVGATYVNGQTIIINGITVTLSTGTTVAAAVIDIIGAAISDVTATNNAGALKISSAEPLTLEEGLGTALEDLGLVEGTFGKTDRDLLFDPRGNPIPWDNGEYTFIDNASVDANGLDLWNVFQNTETQPTSPVWTITEFDNVRRIQNKRIDVELFEQALVYNRVTNITDIRLNIFDPAKGLFPAQTLKEIDFRLEFNPAKYTDGDELVFQVDPEQSWGEEHFGEVWWDLSTVEYTNYETSSNRERRNKWGRIAPGKSIDIYEWVRSSVPPTEWAALVESVKEQPEESFRYKPSGEAFKADEVDNPPFSQRIVVNQLTNEEEIFFYFWVKNSETIPNVENRDLSVAQVARQLTDPTAAGIPWFAPINQNAMIISNTEPFLTNNDSVLQITFDSRRSEVGRHRDWVLTRDGDESDVPTDRFWEKMKDSLVGFDRNDNLVPDPRLEDSRKIGNFIRPRQTWFINREQAGKIFIDCINLLLSEECVIDTRIDLFDNLFNTSAEPTPTVADDGGWSNSFWSGSSWSTAISLDKTVCQFDFHVANNDERDALFVVPGLAVGAQIWVDGTVETEGFWRVYSFDGTDILGNPIFTEICSEAFRVSDFWQLVDFFAEGFDINTEADIIVDTIAERDAIPNPVEGVLVKVNDSNGDNTNLFALYEFTSSDTFNPWVLVGKEDCTIEFDTDLFFDPTYGNVDVLTGLNGRDLAFKEVIDALRNDILTDLEQNLLFFKMIRYVHSEQLLVDWAFKTTYIKAVGLNQTADQDPIFRPDTTDDLIAYIEEAKPYHTKLRDFVINQDIGFDIQENNVTDFDKPVFFDTLLDDFRVLDPNDPDDIEIMLDPDAAQNDWFLNYQNEPNPIRKLNTTIKFDRVSCGITGGWDPVFGWDFGPNEDWDLGIDSVSETAAERILKFYQPHPLTENDIDVINEELAKIVIEEKDLEELISGCSYKGTFVDGDGMIIDINDFDTFLNPSQSAEYVGDGLENTFAIPLAPVVPTSSNVQVYLLDTGWSSGGFSSSWSSSPWSGPDSIANGLQIEGVDYTVDGAITEVTFTVVPAVGTRIIVVVGAWLLANPGAPIGPADIIVDGNLLIDPFNLEGHPEELVLQTTGEALSICVDTEEAVGPNAPAIAFRLFLDNENAKEALNIKSLIKTALSEGITAGQTAIKVDDIARFPPFGEIIIVTKSTLGNFTIVEHIEYDSVDKLTRTLGVVLDGRGVNNTIPAEHFLGDIVLVLDPLVPEIATFDSFRISDAGKTELAQQLEITDTEIELESVAGLPKQLVSQEFMTTPGVIWIGNERIEYFRRDGTTLKHIRRGTKGTSSGIPARYDLNGDLISDYRTGTLLYPAGTVVTDGTKKQEIPGGYEWAPEASGLQFSDSILAEFLLDKPGTCPEPIGYGWSDSSWSNSPWSF